MPLYESVKSFASIEGGMILRRVAEAPRFRSS